MGGQQPAAMENKRHRHEGPKNHYLTFLVSSILTILAFVSVMYGLENTSTKEFVYAFILVLAVIQALFQAFVWMHLKDKGHLYPIIFLSAGVIVAFTCIVMGIYWLWW